MADDQKPQNPASPSDQSTPPADIGQQPISTWPNSTNLANDQSSADSSLSNLANLPAEADASAKVGDQQSTPSAELVPEPPKEETPPQAPSPEIGQVEENSASANLANPTPPTVEPVVSADLSTEVEAKADSPATSSPPPVSPPLPSFPSSPTDLSSSIPTLETSPPPVTPSEPSEC